MIANMGLCCTPHSCSTSSSQDSIPEKGPRRDLSLQTEKEETSKEGQFLPCSLALESPPTSVARAQAGPMPTIGTPGNGWICPVPSLTCQGNRAHRQAGKPGSSVHQ